MLRRAGELYGFAIHATDGEIGHVDQLLFDDEKWTIRYLVVDTGGWLTGRRVLISPIALGALDWDKKWLSVRLTRQQVENSPDLDTEQPVSRQQEIDYLTYYGWPYYWGGSGLWGGGMYPGFLAAPPITTEETPSAAGSGEEMGDPHLRSTREVVGYQVQARDGAIGHVDDFIVDDESWAIRYILVDTGGWWAGRKVLVPPDWFRRVSWADRTVEVDLDRETIRNGPTWDPHLPLDREYEQRLYGYYGRPGYWQAAERRVPLASAGAEPR